MTSPPGPDLTRPLDRLIAAANRTQAAASAAGAAGAERYAVDAVDAARRAVDAVGAERYAEVAVDAARRALGAVGAVDATFEAAARVFEVSADVFTALVRQPARVTHQAHRQVRPPGRASRRLVSWAARMLPAGHQARYREEWLSLLTELPARHSRARHLLSILLCGVPGVRRGLRAGRDRSGQRVRRALVAFARSDTGLIGVVDIGGIVGGGVVVGGIVGGAAVGGAVGIGIGIVGVVGTSLWVLWVEMRALTRRDEP